MSWYISGPMRGIPKYNFPLFDEVRDDLIRLGCEVISPADHDRLVDPLCEERPGFAEGAPSDDFSYEELLGWDLEQIASPRCKGIILLPGWENSTGAQHERYVAEACGKVVLIAHKDGRYDIWTYKPDPDRTLSAKRECRRWAESDLEHAAHLQPTPTPVIEGRYPGLTVQGGTGNVVQSQVIGLTGYAQVGKDTLAQVLVREHGFTRIAFADTLRDCAYALNPYVCVDPPSHQGKPFSFKRLQFLVNRVGWDEAKRYDDVRGTLQRLGTEVGRNILGGDIWVNTAMKLVKPGGRYVFTDVRFPNEFEAIRQLGGAVVRIQRTGYEPVNAHVSETAVAGLHADLEVLNDSTPEALADTVVRALGL